MTGKTNKIGKAFRSVGKAAKSKEFSELLGTVGKSFDVAIGTVEATAEVINHQLDERNKRHANDVKVPDIRGVSLTQAKELFDSLGIRYALLVPEPAENFAVAKPDTIAYTIPKVNTVIPAGSFVKIFYVDYEIIAASQAIVAVKADRKRIRKEAAKGIATKIRQGAAAGTGSVFKAAAGATKRIVKHDRKLKVRKEIDATIIDMPTEDMPSDDVTE